MSKSIDFIYFAIEQAKEAERFGFKRNQCCRNLKLAIEHYWRKVYLGLTRKGDMPRSVAASTLKLADCDIEHVIPLMVLVNKLMDKKPLTRRYIFDTLTKYYRVAVITKVEHRLLNSKGLTSKMSEGWDCNDLWSRYTAVGITLPE